ncbi:hypothetical protein BWQ96_07909 [Gracilariopsis chorda]|uniref:Uncharacterized protein n=1 Tax=Gracilariopsis chorda TaxID=448386 RepID=A0A2V3IK11_9FLOR|nr:hypothetical protein BWQ96_07909 [Gracilariopsis chorda]|eukprot:PXF42389.1 hypothetical protein BWQ96_07909 [Gracilariopsis chorda]
MQLQLRCIASHPYGVKNQLEYALSATQPRLLTAKKDLIADHNIVTNAVQVTLRTTSSVDKIVSVGGAHSFLAFLHDGHIASYVDSPNAIYLSDERSFDAGRSVTMACGSSLGKHAIFVKADSPSIWCVHVESDGEISKPFKLRSHVDGNQGNMSVVDGVFARVRGKVATSAKSRLCPITAVAVHDELPAAAAVYENGIVRVWDIARKQLQSCFDSQLLMGERPVDIALHPFLLIVVVCTNLGRIMAFNAQSGTFRRGEQPQFACSRIREGKKRFRAMCFTKRRPGYLLLLTTSQRIVVKMINSSNMLVASNRFPKPSRLPSLLDDSRQSLHKPESSIRNRDNTGVPATITCDPTFGLLACSLDNTGGIYVFQPTVAGIPAVQRPVTCGLDTGFSAGGRDIFQGPVLVDPDSVVAHKGCLFRYELGTELLHVCCQLPSGDVRRVEVARDADGTCTGALVFYDGDTEVETDSYADPDPPGRYVLCTKRLKGKWNVSEPTGGDSGCFLGAPGKQDKIFIVSNTGSSASVYSFAAPSSSQGLQQTRQSRGVQRFKLAGNRIGEVFRTPFAEWNAVLYHDIDENRLAVSKNAFDSRAVSRDTYQDASIRFSMDDNTAIPLKENETVLDVRWQKLPSRSEQYLGAIMTDRRIVFVRHVLSVHAVFDMQTISRKVTPFAAPCISWVGPVVMLAQGNSVFSIALNGQADLVANLSHGGHLPALVACLPDRVVYTTTNSDSQKCCLAIASRPYSAVSSTVRGVLSFEALRNSRSANLAETVKAILDTHDASQASAELTDALIESNLTPLAYLIAVSKEGKGSMSPLRRAAFLGQLGEFRGALSILEEEYSRLPAYDSFHAGTELFRMVQRLLNMSFASGDFAVGRRCSALLGRRGTFSAFVDTEGGYAALRSVITAARISKNSYLLDTLHPLVEKSSVSSVATDSSMIVKTRDRQNVQRATKAVDPSAISLGSEDQHMIMIRISPGEDADGKQLPPQETKLVTNVAKDLNDRLMVLRQETFHDYVISGDDNETLYNENEFGGEVPQTIDGSIPVIGKSGGHGDDSADDGIFETMNGDNDRAPQPRKGSAHEANQFAGASSDGDLTALTRRKTEETRQLIVERRQANDTAVSEMKAAAGQMVASQRNLLSTGMPLAPVRAPEMFDRAVRKYGNGRFEAAQMELDTALRSVLRGKERGISVAQQLLNGIVYYHMACRIRIAMEEIASGEHANTIPGRVTYAQLANGLTAQVLLAADRIEGLIQAVDANILLGNFGSAAQAMRMVKELGVPEEKRASLREKYALCQTRGFVDTMPQPGGQLCFRSLKVITSAGVLRCSVCPAIFATDAGVAVSVICPCCGMGQTLYA